MTQKNLDDTDRPISEFVFVLETLFLRVGVEKTASIIAPRIEFHV